jgi:hypothetical protein
MNKSILLSKEKNKKIKIKKYGINNQCVGTT